MLEPTTIYIIESQLEPSLGITKTSICWSLSILVWWVAKSLENKEIHGTKEIHYKRDSLQKRFISKEIHFQRNSFPKRFITKRDSFP